MLFAGEVVDVGMALCSKCGMLSDMDPASVLAPSLHAPESECQATVCKRCWAVLPPPSPTPVRDFDSDEDKANIENLKKALPTLP